MAVVTTYICDVSGVQGHNVKDFVQVTIRTASMDGSYMGEAMNTVKCVHKDVAKRLRIMGIPKADEEKLPEPTLESKLLTIMKDYISEIAYEAGAEAGAEQASHRG